MAGDGITLNPMAGGPTVDTEHIVATGRDLQRVKLARGAVDTDEGDIVAAAPLATQGGYTEPAVSAASALNADIFTGDVRDYRWVSVHVTAVATGGLLSFQGSNDNINWFTVMLVNSASATSAGVPNTGAVGLWLGPLGFRYFRVRQTNWTSGSSTAVLELFSLPSQLPTLGMQGSVTGNTGSLTSDSGSPVKTGLVFNSTPPSAVTGQRIDSQGTTHGALHVATNGLDAFQVDTPFLQANPNDAFVIGDTVLISPDQAGIATLLRTGGLNWAQSTSDQTLAAANARTSTVLGRRGLIISNTSTNGYLHIMFGAPAVTTGSGAAWIARVPPGASWSMDAPLYNGAVHGIWDVTGSGFAVVTEITS